VPSLSNNCRVWLASRSFVIWASFGSTATASPPTVAPSSRHSQRAAVSRVAVRRRLGERDLSFAEGAFDQRVEVGRHDGAQPAEPGEVGARLMVGVGCRAIQHREHGEVDCSGDVFGDRLGERCRRNRCRVRLLTAATAAASRHGAAAAQPTAPASSVLVKSPSSAGSTAAALRCRRPPPRPAAPVRQRRVRARVRSLSPSRVAIVRPRTVSPNSCREFQ